MEQNVAAAAAVQTLSQISTINDATNIASQTNGAVEVIFIYFNLTRIILRTITEFKDFFLAKISLTYELILASHTRTRPSVVSAMGCTWSIYRKLHYNTS